MKYLFIILLMPLFCNAQTSGGSGLIVISGPSYGISDYETTITYDTTNLFAGLDTVHQHNFVRKSNNINRAYTCMVLHSPCGCPDGWMNDDIICTICLKDYIVQERCTTKLKVTPPDLYEEAKQRLGKIINPLGIH